MYEILVNIRRGGVHIEGGVASRGANYPIWWLIALACSPISARDAPPTDAWFARA